MNGPWRIAAYLALWGLVVLLALRLGSFALESADQQTGGFAAYYGSAWVIVQDGDTSRLYDDDWFERQVNAAGLPIRDIYRPNPPTTAVVLSPLASLEHDSARRIWIGLGLVAVFASIGATMWLTGLRGIWIPAVLALVLIFQPLFTNVQQAQAYGLLLGLFTLAWYGYREQRSSLLGIVLGLLLAFKALGVFIWGVLVIERDWRAVAWGFGSFFTVSIASLAWVDLDTWRAWIGQLVRLGNRSELAVTAYQTQPGIIRQLFVFDTDWNPEPVIDAPLLALMLTVISSAAVLLMSGYAVFHSTDRDLTFALAMIVTVFLSPLSLEYHYTLLLLPIIILIAWSSTQPYPWLGISLIIAVALIGADIEDRLTNRTDDVWALLAYYRLYGAWLLWGICLWACLTTAPSHEADVEIRETAGRYLVNGS